MQISKNKFENLVRRALVSLPEKFKVKLNNLAVMIADRPSKEQLKKVGLKNSDSLLGLFEGYGQAKKLNFGPVLPDRITIFRIAIANSCSNEEEIKRRVTSTVMHEIAHHFGSDEIGARKASK